MWDQLPLVSVLIAIYSVIALCKIPLNRVKKRERKQLESENVRLNTESESTRAALVTVQRRCAMLEERNSELKEEVSDLLEQTRIHN